MNRFISVITVSVFLISFFSTASYSQSRELTKEELVSKSHPNVITTAVPFLTLTPDSRSGALGSSGTASTPDVWSMHWNPAKYAFMNKSLSAGISYTPWLRNLGVNDIDIVYLALAKKLDKMQSLAVSMLYFNLGEISFTDYYGNDMHYSYSPKEFSVDAAYSRLLSDNFSFSIAGRFIYTNLTGDFDENIKAGQSGAADISGYYSKELNKRNKLGLGFNISNIGAKIGYAVEGKKDPIPTTLKLGAGYTSDLDEFNQISVCMDLSKLLVPTPPHAYTDTAGNVQYQGNPKADEESVPVGMITSFYDAPGGFKEEMQEVMIGGGVEYWYDKQFALRGGYYHESIRKGNRKFFTLGLGLRLNVFGIDFAYLVPISGNRSPLANTLRFSLTFDFEALKDEKANNQKATK